MSREFCVFDISEICEDNPFIQRFDTKDQVASFLEVSEEVVDIALMDSCTLIHNWRVFISDKRHAPSRIFNVSRMNFA